MLKLQYLRGILCVNNFVSCILAFLVAPMGTYWRFDSFHMGVFTALGTFLIVSWVHNVWMVSYTRYRLGTSQKEGYFRVPLNTDEFGVPLGDLATEPSIGPKMALMNVILDLSFALAFLILSSMSLAVGRGQAEAAAGIGGIVALVVHVFFSVVNFKDTVFGRYKIKLVFVLRDQPEARDETETQNRRDVAAGKEQRSSEESSNQEPESLSPRPYRGSPSTKPAQPSNLSSDGPIRFIEPTEGDALIVDHD